MFDCTFDLNDKPMSELSLGALSFAAFSGRGANADKCASICMVGAGPIPLGTYCMFDREAGGILGPLRDLFTGRDDWFALYAADGRIDDETYCNEVKRGNFRLHPKGGARQKRGPRGGRQARRRPPSPAPSSRLTVDWW